MDSMIGDIVERPSTETTASDPKPIEKSKSAPRKRWGSRRRPIVVDPSAQQRPPIAKSTQQAPPIATGAPSTSSPLSDSERVHLENIRKMQQMTPEEIEREREEIFRSMDPNVLQSLLRRAELKEEETSAKRASTEAPQPAVFQSQRYTNGTMLDNEGVNELLGSHTPENGSRGPTSQIEPELAASAPSKSAAQAEEETRSRPDSHRPVSPPTQPSSTVHFPPPPEELQKFFPNLPVETEKLAWMQPIAAEEEQEYSEQLVSVAPSELRFDFNGNLITPRLSRLIDTSRGLHHHGDAPSAAGYTLPELAHLSRSSHPAQRAMAIQTVGRVLHKLRLRKFAKSSELQEGLNRLVEATRIMETLTEAASERTRNLTVRTYATEALWLANTTPEKHKKHTAP